MSRRRRKNLKEVTSVCICLCPCGRSPALSECQKLLVSNLSLSPSPFLLTTTHTCSCRAMEKRVSRLVSECESEAEQKRARESRILDLEKELTILRHDQNEVGRKLDAQEKEKKNVSGEGESREG